MDEHSMRARLCLWARVAFLAMICGVGFTGLIAYASTTTSSYCASGTGKGCGVTDRVPRPNLGSYGPNQDGSWADNGPQVYLPFVNDFGRREVRMTDGRVPGGPTGEGWGGGSLGFYKPWSVYDSSFGGYYIIAELDNTETYRMFQMNAATMTVTPVSHAGWSAGGYQVPYAGAWSYVTPGLMYYSTSAGQVCTYNYDTFSGSGSCSDGVGTLIYDFAASCPGLSGTTGWGTVDISKDDTVVSIKNASIEALYSSAYSKCYWQNNKGGTVGGTDNPTPISSGLPFPGAPTLGTVGTASGGGIPAGTYYVEESLTTDTSGRYETLPSQVSSAQTISSGTQTITVGAASITGNTLLNNVGKYCNVYMGTSASGPFYEQLTNQSCTSTLNVTSYSTSGNQPLVESQVGFGFHAGKLTFGGNIYATVPNQTSGGENVEVFWQAFDGNGNETSNTYLCPNSHVSCSGHDNAGYGSDFYVRSETNTGGVPAHYDFGMTQIPNPSSVTAMHPSGPPYGNIYSPDNECNVHDTHTDWNGDDPSDLSPVAVTSFVDASTNYSLMAIQCAWDHEVDDVSTDGSGVTYRLAHNRATGQQNPLAGRDSQYNALSLVLCSPDNKYCLWQSDWQAALGNFPASGVSGDPTGSCATNCVWEPSTAYSSGQTVFDSNGNEEYVSAAGTSGSSEPGNWSKTISGTTTDGSVTWKMYPGCDTSQTTSTQGVCRTDVFIVEVRDPAPYHGASQQPTIASASTDPGATNPTDTCVPTLPAGATAMCTVTITGTGFQSGATVNIDGQAATNVDVVSSTEITATVPQSSKTDAAVDLDVVNPGGLTARLAGGFFYGKIIWSDGIQNGNFNNWTTGSFTNTAGAGFCIANASGVCQSGTIYSGSEATGTGALTAAPNPTPIHDGSYVVAQVYARAGSGAGDSDTYMIENLSTPLTHYFVRWYEYFATPTTIDTSVERKTYYGNVQTSHRSLDIPILWSGTSSAGQLGQFWDSYVSGSFVSDSANTCYSGSNVNFNSWYELETESQTNTTSPLTEDGYSNTWLNGSIKCHLSNAYTYGSDSTGLSLIDFGMQISGNFPNTDTFPYVEWRYLEDGVIADAYIP